MGVVVVLAEKPSAARNFSKALGGMSGTYKGQDYLICALRGHVMGLSKDLSKQVPKERLDFYQKWSLGNLPWNPDDFCWKKEPRGDVADVFKRLKSALSKASEVSIATDDDPSGEGELLAWEALEKAGWRGRTSRMWFVDESVPSVRKAFEQRTPIESMERDGDFLKARCRERWDFLSMQLTRISTCIAHDCGFDSVVRQGRLKSVIVWLVGEQQKAYEDYKKVPFFEARFKDENGVTYARKAEDAERFASAGEVDLSKLHESAVVEDSRASKRKAPPRPLDLMGLTALLGPKGFDPKEVLATYQKMYEDQVVSYPRTEDKFVSPEQFNDLLPLVDKIAHAVGVDPAALSHRQPRKGLVKIGGAHGANRPGPNVPASLESLSKYGRSGPAIYEALARSYLAMMAEDYEYELVKGHVSDFPDFTGSVSVPTSAGWKAVFDQADDDGDEGQTAKGLGRMAAPFCFEGANKRPSQPSLDWLKKRLEKYNVGTAATRVSTIADISDGTTKALLANKKGKLSLTDCGKVSHALLAGCSISSPEETEKLFGDMERVGKGELDGEQVVGTVTDVVRHDLVQMKGNAGALKAIGLSNPSVVGKCPRCGRDVRLSKSGKLYYCTSKRAKKDPKTGKWVTTDPGCGFKFTSTVCGKKLSRKQAEDLLAGKTISMKGLNSKKGSTFDAGVRINPESEWGTELVFDGAPRSGGARKAAGRAHGGRGAHGRR